MLPDVLDFRISAECNMKCPFCFGTKSSGKLNFEKLSSFFRFLREKGVKNVAITGGEPTLASDFPEIVVMLKRLGYHIALSTNGTFWENDTIRKLVFNYCDWIALPIDASVEHVHNHLRNFSTSHFELVCSLLSKIRIQAPDLKIKIGTVVTKENIEDVAEILDILPEKPDSWKLFQLSRTKYNYKYYEKYKVPDKEFQELIQDMLIKYKGLNTQIFFSYERERNGRYLFLEPSGELMTICNDEERVIGNYCDESENLAAKIERFVDAHRTNDNFHNSFVKISNKI